MEIEDKNKTIVFCGLPASGKTTFLGALSYLVDNEEIKKELEFAGLPADRRFFNELADKWLECEPMLRTHLMSKEQIILKLKKDDLVFSLNLPDMSGETWDNLWREHEIDKSVLDKFEDSDSVIFFIHADNISSPVSILQGNAMIKSLIDDNCSVTAERTTSWIPSEHAPTQAIVVDILQKLASNFLKKSKVKKLAIVFSAWDTTDGSVSPRQLIEKEMPLLHQYLNCHFDYQYWQVFGVSAQGGNLKDSQQQQELLEREFPSKRVKVVTEEEEHSDLTKIISWILSK